MLPVDYRRLKSYGGTPLESKLNDIVDTIQTNAINNGVGYSVAASPNGSYLKLSPAQAPANYYPFQILDATTVSGSVTGYQVRVVYGQVLTQVNESGQMLITPSGLNPGDKPSFILPVTENSTVNLRVLTDSTTYFVNPSNLPSISIQTSTPSDSEFSANISIGSVTVPASGAYLTISQGMRGIVGYINALGIPVWY